MELETQLNVNWLILFSTQRRFFPYHKKYMFSMRFCLLLGLLIEKRTLIKPVGHGIPPEKAV